MEKELKLIYRKTLSIPAKGRCTNTGSAYYKLIGRMTILESDILTYGNRPGLVRIRDSLVISLAHYFIPNFTGNALSNSERRYLRLSLHFLFRRARDAGFVH
jgi:hypothetical protein